MNEGWKPHRKTKRHRQRVRELRPQLAAYVKSKTHVASTSHVLGKGRGWTDEYDKRLAALADLNGSLTFSAERARRSSFKGGAAAATSGCCSSDGANDDTNPRDHDRSESFDHVHVCESWMCGVGREAPQTPRKAGTASRCEQDLGANKERSA